MRPSILTPSKLEEQHTASEYLSWVHSLIAQVKEEQEGLKKIRLRLGLGQKLMNEALPVGILASKLFDSSTEVDLALKVGNQNYDATVSDHRADGLPIAYIEVTVAGEGWSDYLRMRALHEQGQVSGLGKVDETWNKNSTLPIFVESEMVSQTELLNRERDSLSKAIERKIKKVYLPNTILALAFDDTMAFGRHDSISNIESVLDTYFSKLKNFHSVAVMGTVRGLFVFRKT